MAEFVAVVRQRAKCPGTEGALVSVAEAAFMLGRRREVKWDVVVCRRGGGNKQQHPREEEEPNLRSAEERKGGVLSLPFPPFASYEIPFA